jgi:hypothetical protein
MTDQPPKRKRKVRAHLPVLPPHTLTLFLQQLALLDISVDAKRQIAAMMNAAANPDAESPEVIMQTLSRERQANMRITARELDALSSGVASRGRAALFEMDEAEFDELVRQANAEDDKT